MPTPPYLAPPPLPLDYLFVDRSVLVVDKPSGLLSVPGRGDGKADCLVARVQADFPDARIVHRLDMDTSGLMVLARGSAAQRALSLEFQARRVGKRYIAVVDGLLSASSGTIDLPLVTDWPNRPRQRVDFAFGKQSLTHFRVLERDRAASATRLELMPETGRSHQLRVHLLSIGHAILGDPLYATPAACARAPRLLLHATRLAFAHPEDGRPIELSRAAPF